MSVHRYIYWRPDIQPDENGWMLANIHLLVGYNQGTVSDFQSMSDELRKTFPLASNSEIRCGKVRESSSVFGFSIIALDTYIPKGDYPDWIQIPNGRPKYLW